MRCRGSRRFGFAFVHRRLERKGKGRGKFWKEYIGSPISDRERLIATSPIKHVSNIRAPLAFDSSKR